MFKIIGFEIYYKDVFVATINKNLIPSFRDEVEQVIKNDFYSEKEINQIREAAKQNDDKSEA